MMVELYDYEGELELYAEWDEDEGSWNCHYEGEDYTFITVQEVCSFLAGVANVADWPKWSIKFDGDL